MDTDRVVLKWFLNAMPNGSWNDLVKYYEHAIQEVIETSELF